MINRWSARRRHLGHRPGCRPGPAIHWRTLRLDSTRGDASTQFLALLGEGKIADAYASTADGFRAQQAEASFTTAAKQLSLTDYSSVFWHSRQIDNMEGITEGTVTTKSGSTTLVAIRLVRDQGKWSVVGVRYAGVGFRRR